MKLLPFPLAWLQAGQKKQATAPADPEAKAIAAIEKAGGSVRQIAQNDERREVSFYLEGAAIRDEHVAAVASLKRVAQLHLGKTSLTDAGLAYVKGLTDLEELHLEGTKITDKGLVNLAGMKKLTYLNLYNTAITDAGLAHLTGLGSLKNLYVWQTKVTKEGIEKLKKSLPNASVVTGWDTEAKPAEKKAEEKK
ncbi:MAG: hypothetical protein HY235_11485 [Acidobacteria bacterium]|nr:hypothetical protein [Acidobacteriota bacterium]